MATYEKGNTSETYNIHKCKLIAKTNITRKSYLNYMKRDGWKLSKRQYNKSLISYFPEGTAVIDWPHDKIESKIILYINAVVGDSPDLLYLILDKARRMKERLETKYPKLKISNDLSDLHLIRDFHISSIIDPFAIHSYALGINKQCKEVEASWLSEWEEKGMSAEDNMNAIYKMRQLIKLHNITELELADIIDKHLQSVSDKKTECLHNINRDASATSETLREKSKKRVIVVPKIHADQNSKKEQSASESSNVNIKLNIDITITT